MNKQLDMKNVAGLQVFILSNQTTMEDGQLCPFHWKELMLFAGVLAQFIVCRGHVKI
jgi:hypothetical protein